VTLKKSELYRLRLVPWLSLPEPRPKRWSKGGQIDEALKAGKTYDDVAVEMGVQPVSVIRMHKGWLSQRADS